MPTRSSRLKTLREITNAFPPFLVIAAAKRKWNVEEIARRSNIQIRTMFRLAKTISNDVVKHGQLLALWDACDFDPFCPSQNPTMRYLHRIVERGAQMPHLTRNEWKRFCGLVEKAREAKQKA